MRRYQTRMSTLVVLIVLASMMTVPAFGAGFAIFEQGAKAMGTAGAFAGVADDASAMYYNVGGLGLISERSIYGGVSAVKLGDVDFQGLAPFPGEGQTGKQKDQVLFVPHFYWVEPISDKLTVGIGMNAPFGLTTEWDNKDDWSGRFLSEKAALRTIDLNLAVGYKVSDSLGLGFGLIVRNSDLELERRFGAINPFTQTVVDVAHVGMEGGFDQGYGFTFGFLNKISDRFSWGLNYRSQIDVDYEGGATFDQISSGDPTFDAIVASILPEDQNISTGIGFPDRAALGFGFRATDTIGVNFDAIWWGWSSFDALDLSFEDESLNQSIGQDYEDSTTFRFGVTWDLGEGRQVRFGYYVDESPQPDTSVGPLLPDADRTGFTVGYGTEFFGHHVDLYVLYVDMEERTTTTNHDNFFGTYEGSTILVGGSLGW